MKKIVIFVLMAFLSFEIFAQDSSNKSKMEFGIGSGYVFYGDKATKDLINEINDPSQFIIGVDVAYLFQLNGPVYLSFGADSVFDAHWGGSRHVYLLDYCGNLGFRVYPGFWGFAVSLDYCLGARSDFIDVKSETDVDTTSWGNGYKIGFLYDFSYNSKGFAPEIVMNLRHMPRGNSKSDNIMGIYLRFKS